jgi:protein involved in polysaccharide export with SLBB domain
MIVKPCQDSIFGASNNLFILAHMLRTFFTLLFSALCALGAQKIFCQSPVELATRAQLEQRGISEAELKDRLVQRGIAVERLTTEQAVRLQPIIEQIVKEIEAEHALNRKEAPGSFEPVIKQTNNQSSAQQSKTTASQKTLLETASDSIPRDTKTEVRKFAAKSSQDVAAKVKQGATVEEAISESLLEKADEIVEEKSRIYGQELFRNKSIDVYRSTKDAKPPDSYMLGIGDELTVIIFGASQGDFRYEINEEGYIAPQGMGKIFLKGVPYGKAKELVKARFNRNFLFREDQFVMHLATARTVSINIFGEVANPGTFAISSINTAYNALAAAGGPTDIGSVRNIQVTRSGKSKMLDVYAFMQDGSLQYDFYLESNDVIHVPVAERMITIIGAVKRPSSYELKGTENLSDLIKYAGGLLAGAYRNSVQVRRVIGKKSVMREVDLDKQPTYSLQNGDMVTVKQITESASNIVSVEGEVEFPGLFALEEHVDLASLVFKATPKRTARTDMAFVFRKDTDGSVRIMQVNLDEAIRGNKQPFVLQPADKLLIFKQERYVDAAEVTMIGAVREPKKYPHGNGTRLSDYIQLSGGLKEETYDFGYIIRTSTVTRKKEYIRIQPIKATRDPKEDVLILPSDEVHILSQLDYRDSAFVRVSGAVRKPIELSYGDALTLSDAIALSGGLKLEAKKGRIDIFRVELDKREKSRSLQTTLEITETDVIPDPGMLLQPYDEVVVRAMPEFSMLRKVIINGEVRYPGEYALQRENERISELIQRAGGVTAEAFPEGGRMNRRTDDGTSIVATNIDIAMKQPNSYSDLTLKDGDEITIPKSLDLVTIFVENTQATSIIGEPLLGQRNQILTAFKSGKRGKWYVEEYVGGVGEYSGFKQLKVQYANGRVRKAKNFGLFVITPKVDPGARILLAADPDKIVAKGKREPRKPLDWDKALTQTLAFLSATATIILAVSAIQ